MIVSRGRKYIFVHIPKTGGTSLALALEERAMKDDLLIGDTPKALRRRQRLKKLATDGPLRKHSTLADLKGLMDPETLSGLFCFTLVRNPWDRMVSYYHWLRHQSFDHPAVALSKRTDFAGFIEAEETQEALRAGPAAHYMRDAEGQERCDCYIRLEHFAQDARPLFDHLGFELVLPRANVSDRPRDYRPFYTNPLRDIVAECCHEDIVRFGYRFEASGGD